MFRQRLKCAAPNDDLKRVTGKRDTGPEVNMKSTILPTIVIVIAGSVLGLGFNAVRSKDSIKITRNYFKKYAGPATYLTPGESPGANSGEDDHPLTQAETGDHSLKHSFVSASIEDAISLFQDPRMGTGLVVFVDARDDQHFEEGHIPGAVLIDRYNSDEYWEKAEEWVTGAEIIVVYCGGGDCEDSIFLATELVEERGISFDKIRLFEGGLKQWEGEGLEIEEGFFE